MKISGSNINTPDSLVVEYISKHGRVVHPKVIYDTDKEGPLKGLKNGDRQYLVDFTGGRNMGSFHILDGSRIRVNYSGQKKICGRCYSTASSCPGDAIARSCEVNQGAKISLVDHMKNYWEEIGFKPADFKLVEVEAADCDDIFEDLPIKENEKFTPKHKQSSNRVPEGTVCSGLAIKNLPPQITEPDLFAFLVSMGLPEDCDSLKLIRSDRNTAVDVEVLDNDSCFNLIKNTHEKKFFNRTVYCRGVRNLFSPTKEDKRREDQIDESESEGCGLNSENRVNQQIVSPRSKEDAHRAKKVRQAQNKIEKLKHIKPTVKKQQATTGNDPVHDNEFEFEELDTFTASSLTGSKFFKHSPVSENKKDALSAQQSKKRPSESPQNPKDRKVRSRSISSKPKETEASRPSCTQPTK